MKRKPRQSRNVFSVLATVKSHSSKSLVDSTRSLHSESLLATQQDRLPGAQVAPVSGAGDFS
jgi:hypothetical protein